MGMVLESGREKELVLGLAAGLGLAEASVVGMGQEAQG
jgi:hypothetical protein